MLKHSDIIEKLEPLQKVAVVASGLEREALEQAGLPDARRASLEEAGKRAGVSYPCAVRSWNMELVGAMTAELAAEEGRAGARLIVTPDLKAAVDPYACGLSEDPRFSGACGAEMAKAIRGQGLAVALSRLSLSPSEAAHLDRREDPAAVHDLVISPFLRASAETPCDAVVLTPNRAGSGYLETNEALFADIRSGYFGKDVFAVGEGTAPVSRSVSLLGGKVTLGGAALPLERASRRYAQLTKYVAEGSVTERDLFEAVRDGSALEDEKLNEAADEVADFVIRLSELTPAETEPSDEARKKIAEECIVLLNNRRTLPVSKRTRIAVLGEAYADLTPIEERFEVVGRARGYDRTTDRSDSLIPEAVRIASAANLVLVFLYPDESGRSLLLPANRLALLDALKRAGKRIVALVCGDMPADMSFDRDLAATLLVPEDGPYASEALAKILSGEISPSGRLARTLYDHADETFRSLKEYRDSGRTKVRSFVGYRRYDTAGERVRYPFGFGLGYTRFAYSGLSVSANSVSFTLRNVGRRDGYEVAQVYIGAPSTSRVMPKKELKAFVKVFLKAGERKRVTVPLGGDAFKTFDYATLSENVEGGSYRVYVCSSALDVKLRGRRSVEGVTRKPVREHTADFFPNGDFAADSDRMRENRLENQRASSVPDWLYLTRKGIFYAMPAVAFLFFMLVTMLIFSYVLDFALLYAFDVSTVEWILYVLVTCVLAIMPFFVNFNRKTLSRMRAVSLTACPVLLFFCLVLGYLLISSYGGLFERIAFRVITCLAVAAPLCAIVSAVIERELVRSKSEMNRWAKFYFEQERAESKLGDGAFEEAFRAAEAALEIRPVSEDDTAPVDVPQFYDKHLTYSVLLGDCLQYAKERGLAVEEGELRNWLAALSSTQLILVPQGDGAALCAMVAGYFGRKPYVDNGESYVRPEDLFFRWKEGERASVTTSLGTAFTQARRETVFLHTALIRHVDLTKVGELLTPLADVIARRKTSVPLPDGTEITLPPNVRIVVEVDKDRVERLPAAVAEVAAVLSPKCKETEPSEKKTVVQLVGFERFSAIRQSVRDEFPLGEAAWKSVDRFDERCRSAHIGNILWNKAELHASVVSACGGSANDALDGALATELLPWVRETWKDEVCGGDLADTFAEIFGKGYKLCKEAFKAKSARETKR